MRLRITQYRKKLRDSMVWAQIDRTKSTELFSFLRRFFRAREYSSAWNEKARYLVGSCPTGEIATDIEWILPYTAGHIPGRTVASFL